MGGFLGEIRRGGGDLGWGGARAAALKAGRAEVSGSDTARKAVDFKKQFGHAEKVRKEILNGLQKSRNKFSRVSKIKPDKVNIYLGPNYNFEKRAFFPKFK